ncbi:MAG TPA: molybdopterin-dependent oxidoreductase [Pirellulaceae bacterium]|jgi:sulfite oxidase|nr:molybdopterin-dependent oxidoreductase [Pirellulaceae bacterium]
MRRRTFLQQMAVGAGAAPLVFAWGPRVQGQEGAAPEGADWIVHSEVPHNAEPKLPELIESWITPVEKFFIRSHGPNPEIDAKAHRVTVGGLVENELSFSVDELVEKFPAAETTCTITCAGNRRYEHSKTKPVSGVQWREGAIGNATWSGVKLIDVLKAAGVKPEAKHVWFDGVDTHDAHGHETVFGGSIPIEKAYLETDEHFCLLATKMNGEPLTVDHGAPIRGIVPGYIGARSVKWLGNVTLANRPSPNHYVADAYKLVERDEPLALAEAGILYKIPLNAAICFPPAGARLGEVRRIRVAGYALPPGEPGVTVAEVHVSGDDGKTWRRAALRHAEKEFCWALWRAEIEVSAENPTLVVRAIDSAGGRQPLVSPWNAKGYMYNAWHRVELEV